MRAPKRRQAGARDRRQAEERARLQPVPRLPRRPHRRRRRQSGRGRASASRRPTRPSATRCRSSTPMPASSPSAGARTRRIAVYTDVRRRAAAPPDRARRARRRSKSGKPPHAARSRTRRRAPPRSSTASASSATRQGDELTGDHLSAPRASSRSRASASRSSRLADVYERLKQYDRANEIFARIPKNSPVRPSADIAIGSNLELLGRGDEAVAHLETPHEGAPRRRRGHDGARQRAALAQAFAEAAEIYSKASRAHRHAGSRPLDPLLLPRHLLRARQAVGEGRGRPQEGARTRARRRSPPAGRRC